MTNTKEGISLHDLTDNQLVKKIQTNEQASECLKVLGERHSGIFHIKVSNVNRWIQGQGLTGKFDMNEVIDGKLTILWRVCQTFDEKQGAKFSTYFGQSVYFDCLNLASGKGKSVNPDLYLDSYQNEDGRGEMCFVDNHSYSEGLENNDLEVEVVDYLKDNFSERDSQCFLRWSLENETLQEIGDFYNLSRERVRQIINQVKRGLRGHFKKEFDYQY